MQVPAPPPAPASTVLNATLLAGTTAGVYQANGAAGGRPRRLKLKEMPYAFAFLDDARDYLAHYRAYKHRLHYGPTSIQAYTYPFPSHSQPQALQTQQALQQQQQQQQALQHAQMVQQQQMSQLPNQYQNYNQMSDTPVLNTLNVSGSKLAQGVFTSCKYQ